LDHSHHQQIGPQGSPVIIDHWPDEKFLPETLTRDRPKPTKITPHGPSSKIRRIAQNFGSSISM
jgi:hypothetical protein